MGNVEAAIKNTFFQLEKKNTYQKVPCVLYEPVEVDKKNEIAVLAIHSDGDFLGHSIGSGLARHGYRVMCANTSNKDAPLDEKLLDVNAAVAYLRQCNGVKKVIVMGHSGGATLMSAYQNAAENGAETFQGEEKLIKCSELGPLTPADGVMLLDSNYGNGVMTLLSLDPAVQDETSGKKLDPSLDLFDPENGYDSKGSSYNSEFIRRYQKEQGDRNNRLIDYALERLHAIETGKGKYEDDEPFIVPGGAQNAFNNKLFPQDVRLLSRTRKAWPLIHPDGSITTQIIPCVRKPKNDTCFTGSYRLGSIRSTVRTYLNSSAVRTTKDFSYNEESLRGIEWRSSYSCTPGNIMEVSAPLLIVGMTGGYEFLAAEIIYENARNSKDKTIAFVEGATHNFDTAKDCEQYPGQFGDTMKTLYDFVDRWLMEKGRFLD